MSKNKNLSNMSISEVEMYYEMKDNDIKQENRNLKAEIESLERKLMRSEYCCNCNKRELELMQENIRLRDVLEIERAARIRFENRLVEIDKNKCDENKGLIVNMNIKFRKNNYFEDIPNEFIKRFREEVKSINFS